MAEVYTYALSAFGSGEYDVGLFQTECQAALSAAPYQFVRSSSQVELWFESAVNQTTLNGVVAAHQGLFAKAWDRVFVDPVFEPVVPGASKVLANARPAVEVDTGITGFASIQAVWPLPSRAGRQLRLRIKFILKALGTGSSVRIAAKVKGEGVGDDSSAAFTITGFVAVPVTHTTLGEVFGAELILDASSLEEDDAVAIHIGRDGNNELGSGTNDDVNQAIQIIAMRGEVA